MSIDSSQESAPPLSRNGDSKGDVNGNPAAELKPADHASYPSQPGKRLLGYDEVLAAGAYPRSARDSTRRRLLVGADIASLAMALAVTGVGEHLAHPWYRLAATVALWVLLNKVLGLYDWDSTVIDKWTFNELPRLAQSVAIAAATLFILGPPAGLNVHRYVALEFGALTLAAMWASRVARSVGRVASLRSRACADHRLRRGGRADRTQAADPPELRHRGDRLCRRQRRERRSASRIVADLATWAACTSCVASCRSSA